MTFLTKEQFEQNKTDKDKPHQKWRDVPVDTIYLISGVSSIQIKIEQAKIVSLTDETGKVIKLLQYLV